MTKEKLMPITIGVLSVVIFAIASWWFFYARYFEVTDNAYVHADINYISPKLSGFVSAGWIADNQSVKKGEVLARIDDTDFKLKVRSASAKVNAAKASISELEARQKLQESEVQRAHSAVDSAKAELELSLVELERIRSLQKSGFSSVSAN